MSREAIQSLTRNDIAALSSGQVAAFTTTGIGCLSWGKPAPMALAAVEIGFAAPEAALAIERAVHDTEHQAEWAALSAWSLLILGHGIGSAIIGSKGDSPPLAEARAPARSVVAAPYFTASEGAYTLGAVGQF